MMYADNCCEYKEIYSPEHRYEFTGKCIITGKVVTVSVPAKELYAYRKGAHIQVAMPSLSAGDREFLMSGISDEGWKKTFPKGDEE